MPSFAKNMEICEVLRKNGSIWSFAKNIKLCLSFSKFMELCQVLPNLWNYVKFSEKYGIMWSFAKNIKLCFSFAKFMELCEVLPKIWKYVKFCHLGFMVIYVLGRVILMRRMMHKKKNLWRTCYCLLRKATHIFVLKETKGRSIRSCIRIVEGCF